MSEFRPENRAAAAVVTVPLALRLTVAPETELAVEATLHYRPSDPWATQLTITAPGRASVTWTFSRDLLRRGQFRACGDGDVRVEPVGPDPRLGIRICLRSPEGQAMLLAARGPVEDYLAQAYAAVPEGAEDAHLDLDALTDSLLR